MVQLAFVLITRNQAWNVDRLLRSIFNEPAFDEAWEIVLVDSALTDATIDLAQIHPITILQLDSTERLTAAAGRLVGYWHTTAEHVMFLDGDMELLSGWIPDALEILAQDRTIGVVANTLIGVPIQGEGGDVAPVALSSGAPEFDEAPHGGGAALYRRAALREAAGQEPSALRGDLDGRQAAGSWPTVAPRHRRRLPSPRRHKRAQPAPAGSPPPRCGGSASL